jgi:galactokinase
MRDVVSLHLGEFGGNPTVVASSPGVANLMGAHTEATDGLVLLFGMAHRAVVGVSPRNDNSLRLFAPDISERKRTSLAAIKFRKEDRFANLAKGVIRRLQTLGAHVSGADITVASDIPQGIGLGSSQAISTAVAYALGTLLDFPVDPETAAQIAHHAEHSFCGTEVGLASFLASALAIRGSVMLIDTHRLSWSHVKVDMNGHRLLGINTQAPSPESPEESRTRIEDCQLCLDVLSGGRHATSMQDVSMQELYSSMGLVPEAARRHCLHVVGENERVLQMVDALRRSDYDHIGRLLLESHESLRDLYEVSTPEVDWVVRHAGDISGVFGARLAGGNRSSCALAIASGDAVDSIRERLHEYERIFGFHPDLVPCSMDDGVRIDLLED